MVCAQGEGDWLRHAVRRCLSPLLVHPRAGHTWSRTQYQDPVTCRQRGQAPPRPKQPGRSGASPLTPVAAWRPFRSTSQFSPPARPGGLPWQYCPVHHPAAAQAVAIRAGIAGQAARTDRSLAFFFGGYRVRLRELSIRFRTTEIATATTAMRTQSHNPPPQMIPSLNVPELHITRATKRTAIFTNNRTKTIRDHFAFTDRASARQRIPATTILPCV